MNTKDVSLIIPSHNNLVHLKNAYESVRKYYPEVELIIIDDASTDGTKDWLESLDDCRLVWWHETKRRTHTVLYDKGIEASTKPVVGILHADMYIGPTYLENLLKHLERGVVVCATRVEPPLHPAGKEKIIRDFGQDFDSLDMDSFYKFALEEQERSKNKTTRGMFAPWLLHVEDFWDVGGHDWDFKFPYEDSDLFQRWILNGYKLIQSRDSLVYHLTCRGHRWTEEVGKDSDEFKMFEAQARDHYIRKWGSWIENDEWGHPVIIPVYKKKFTLTSPNDRLSERLEPWFNGGSDIEVTINPNTFTEADFRYITILNKIIKSEQKIGQFRIGNIYITVNSLNEYQDDLIYN